MKKREDLTREVETAKRALAQQNSLTAVETVKVEQSIAEEERLLYEQSDLRIEVVELTRLAAIKVTYLSIISFISKTVLYKTNSGTLHYAKGHTMSNHLPEQEFQVTVSLKYQKNGLKGILEYKFSRTVHGWTQR